MFYCLHWKWKSQIRGWEFGSKVYLPYICEVLDLILKTTKHMNKQSKFQVNFWKAIAATSQNVEDCFMFWHSNPPLTLIDLWASMCVHIVPIHRIRINSCLASCNILTFRKVLLYLGASAWFQPVVHIHSFHGFKTFFILNQKLIIAAWQFL